MKLLPWLSMGLLLAINPIRAEDPLLGQIKVIKCVGCQPGKVTLVIHDPIEVSDYEITIMDIDYGKIVAPLPGKMIYEGANSCFYWNEKPKIEMKLPVADSSMPQAKPALKKAGLAKKGKEVKASAEDSSEATTNPLLVANAMAPAEVRPSKCIPYQKVVHLPKAGKQD